MLTRNLHVAFVLFASLSEHAGAFHCASSCLICWINDLERDSEPSRTTDVPVNTMLLQQVAEVSRSAGSDLSGSAPPLLLECGVLLAGRLPCPPPHLLESLLFDEDHRIQGRCGLLSARPHCASIRASAKRLMCDCKRRARSHVSSPVTAVLRKQLPEADGTRWKQAAIIISHSTFWGRHSVFAVCSKFKGNLCDLLAFTSA